MWREGLHDYFPGLIAPPRATGHLHEQLEGAFIGAKIGDVHRDIRVDQSDQCDIGEIESLPDHLRADEHINLARAKLGEHFAKPILLAHRIRIHPFDARARQHASHRFFHPLGAHPAPANFRRTAFRTRHRGRFFRST